MLQTRSQAASAETRRRLVDRCSLSTAEKDTVPAGIAEETPLFVSAHCPTEPPPSSSYGSERAEMCAASETGETAEVRFCPRRLRLSALTVQHALPEVLVAISCAMLARSVARLLASFS